MDNIKLIQLSNYVKPTIKEKMGQKWVLNGDKNSFFDYVIDRKNGSPTNNAIINTYHKLLFGKGITIKDNDEVYEDLAELFTKTDQRNALNDFYDFGMYALKLVRSVGGGVAKIKHFPINKLGMGKADKNGEINEVFYCYDWNNPNKYKPVQIHIFKGKMTDKEMILLHKPYQSGCFYYAMPSYLSGLQYAEIEEEISNFSINHIKNGLSFGYVINFNNGGAVSNEQRNEIERRIKDKLTGSSNAGKFVLSFNDGKEAEVTVTALDVNDAHNQWESLRDDAKYQILTSHGVTSPLLFSIQNATGFGSNADELNVASKLLQDYQIAPRQEEFLDALKPVLELANLETDLEFIELRDSYTDVEPKQVVKDEAVEDLEEEVEERVEMSEDYNADNVDLENLISKGEVIDLEEWDLVDDRKCDEISIKESMLNTIFQFAKAPKGVRTKGDKLTSKKESNQDTSLFKVRYRYAGNPRPQREFCQKVMRANKVYRSEDLINAKGVNKGFGINGADNYNIFLYKGGVNCKHFWQRVIYLKKGNNKISVNQARKMILELEPEDRASARWEQNPKEVAQVASPSNNFWRVN